MIADDVKLDRKRSYGTVYGDPNIGFVQDNKNFRVDGTLLPEKPKDASPVAAPAAAIPAVPTVEEIPTASDVNPVRSAAQKQAWEQRKLKRTSELETSDGAPSAVDVG